MPRAYRPQAWPIHAWPPQRDPKPGRRPASYRVSVGRFKGIGRRKRQSLPSAYDREQPSEASFSAVVHTSELKLFTASEGRHSRGSTRLRLKAQKRQPLQNRVPPSPTALMIKLYYHPSPNPAKVALFLEEAGLEYELVPVDTRKGEQHLPAFTAINPNAKTPALVDGEVVVFDSNAILLYLAEKSGKFLPEDTRAARAEMLSWLMFVATGIGPYSGQAVHFKHFAPDPKVYAVNRYDFEARRHWKIVDARLAERRWMLGDSYTLVDMAVWGWARAVPFVLGADAWQELKNVKRLLDEVNARPAAQRVEALKAKHAYKTEMDDDARKAMFPQNARLSSQGAV